MGDTVTFTSGAKEDESMPLLSLPLRNNEKSQVLKLSPFTTLLLSFKGSDDKVRHVWIPSPRKKKGVVSPSRGYYRLQYEFHLCTR